MGYSNRHSEILVGLNRVGNRLCDLCYTVTKSYRADYPKKRFPARRSFRHKNVLKCSKNPLSGSNSAVGQSWWRCTPVAARHAA